MKHEEIDWKGTLYLTNMILLIGTFIYNSNNILTCWETSTYQVWICNTSILNYFIVYFFFIIWFIWTLFMVIDLFCLKWKDNQGG